MPKPKPHLEGPRVTLAPFRRRDMGEFIRLNRRSRSRFVHPPTTPKRFERYFTRGKLPDIFRLAVRRNEDGVILGSIEVSQIYRGILQSAYLGYHIGTAFQGQGYMSEAMRLVLDFSFGPLKLHRVEANIQPTNTPSIRLVKRMGFRNEGTAVRYLKIDGAWRDHQRWAILAEEWRVQRRRGKRPRRSR
jgi:ribosomal-protein-alanine N-acetyltransferase